jgi:hypothetical protein
MVYNLSFIEIGSGVKKLIRRDTQTYRSHIPTLGKYAKKIFVTTNYIHVVFFTKVMKFSTIQQFASDIEHPEDDQCRSKYVMEIILIIKYVAP